jgi:hypothetical protein
VLISSCSPVLSGDVSIPPATESLLRKSGTGGSMQRRTWELKSEIAKGAIRKKYLPCVLK